LDPGSKIAWLFSTLVAGEVFCCVELSIKTPLSQTNFFPDLIHVNFLPEATEVEPDLLQADPALIAPNAGAENKEPIRTEEKISA